MEQEGRNHAVVAPVLRAVPSVVAAVVAGDVPAAAVPVRPPAAVQVAAVLARGVAEEAAEEAGEELRELKYVNYFAGSQVIEITNVFHTWSQSDPVSPSQKGFSAGDL